jgi:excisionase family DNA binding protein
MTVAERERPALMRPEDAAALLQVSRSKIYRLVADGWLPSVRLTGSVRIPRAALLELIEATTSWPGAVLEVSDRRTALVAHTRTAPPEELDRSAVDHTTARRS